MIQNSQLTISISRTSVHFAEVLRSNQNVVWEKYVELTENSSEDFQNKISQLFDDIQELKTDYQEYSLAWITKKNILIPTTVFEESSAPAIFSLMFGEKNEAYVVDNNRLTEMKMVNVYEIQESIKDFFIKKFPLIHLWHEHTFSLRAFYQKNTTERKIVVSNGNSYVNIDVFQEEKLAFSNNFEIASPEDVVYYLLFILKQEKLTDEKGEIYFVYSDQRGKEILTRAMQQITEIRPFKQLNLNPIESLFNLQVSCV